VRAESNAMDEPKVKGVAFRSIEICFSELCGERLRDEARAHMHEELGSAYRYQLLMATSWYPIEWYRNAFSAYRRVTSVGPELARQIGRLAARHDMKGVHKQILARLISPQALLGMSQRVFNTYYDTGLVQTEDSRRGYARIRCSGCRGWDENMWCELVGSCESLLEIAGARHVRSHVLQGGHDGNDEMTMESRWA
jgi:hypothetical protein